MTRRLVLAAFWCCLAAVTVLALLPSHIPPAGPWDKANHVFAFAVLGLLALHAWPARPGTVLRALLVYGVALEFAQALTPTRTGDWRDVIADGLGLAVAWGCVAVLQRLRGVRRGGSLPP